MRTQRRSSETFRPPQKDSDIIWERRLGAPQGVSHRGAKTVPPGCTEEKLTRAESDTNVKQTLVKEFV